MTNRDVTEPVSVRESASPTGETSPRSRWAWTEASVWTDRMLIALEGGIKGGKWYSLWDKVTSAANLEASWKQVKRNKGAAGVDHQTVEMYTGRADTSLKNLRATLLGGHYRPQAIKRVHIPKPGSNKTRPLGIPTVRDRIVQTAIVNVLEPIFEARFAPQSYGFRPNRKCHDAIQRVRQLLADGHHYVVDADLQSYFDTIPHDRLMELVRGYVSDGKVLDLVGTFLTQRILDDLTSWTPERGTPQGAVLSPLLSNIYLDPLDHAMADLGFEMIRYADDFVIMCKSQVDAETALAYIQQWTTAVGLTLHPEKTCIADARQAPGFEFLGFHFERGHLWPRDKSVKQLKDSIRKKAPRKSGRSIEETINDVSRTLSGWFEYFHPGLRNVHTAIDKWTRMRLRSILRKRSHRKGRGRGRDHNRWPNAFFAAHGLFSLDAAHALKYPPATAANH